jgi:hypothetical protein
MTPVTRVSSLLAAAALAAGVLPVVPAVAEQPSDPVSGLVGGLLGQQPQHHERRDRADYGHTSAKDGILRRGCHDYPYRYVVTTPTDDWTLETFLDDRTGETIASGAFNSDSDPARNRTHFRFCRYSTYAGKFTIRAKVHWYGDSGEDHKLWLEPSHFRLRRP